MDCAKVGASFEAYLMEIQRIFMFVDRRTLFYSKFILLSSHHSIIIAILYDIIMQHDFPSNNSKHGIFQEGSIDKKVNIAYSPEIGSIYLFFAIRL